MANKHMKRCLPSLAMWEMQIKTMITPIRLLKIKSLRMASVVSDGEQWKFWYHTKGSVNRFDLFCQPFPVSIKVEDTSGLCPAILPQGRYLTKTLPYVHEGHRKRFIAELSLIAPNSQEPQCPLTKEWININK